MGPAQRRRRDLGEADAFDFALLLEAHQGFHDVFDGPDRITPVNVIKLDAVDLQIP